MNIDERRSPQKHSFADIVSHVVCIERGREEEMVLDFECPCHSNAKLWENEIYVDGQGGGIFSRGQAETGVADRLGSVHQSRNSCEQCWCRPGGWKGQLWAVVSPSQPPAALLKKCATSTCWRASAGPSCQELLGGWKRAAERNR